MNFKKQTEPDKVLSRIILTTPLSGIIFRNTNGQTGIFGYVISNMAAGASLRLPGKRHLTALR